MRFFRPLLAVVCVFVLALFCSPIFLIAHQRAIALDSPELPPATAAAVDAAPVAIPAPAVEAPKAGWLDSLFAFIGSAAGVTAIAGTITAFLAWLWTRKPAWKAIYDTYRPALIAGVKYAEKIIPDDSPNKALLRADAALKKAIEIDAALAQRSEVDAAKAVLVVHAEAEAGGNI